MTRILRTVTRRQPQFHFNSYNLMTDLYVTTPSIFFFFLYIFLVFSTNRVTSPKLNVIATFLHIIIYNFCSFSLFFTSKLFYIHTTSQPFFSYLSLPNPDSSTWLQTMVMIHHFFLVFNFFAFLFAHSEFISGTQNRCSYRCHGCLWRRKDVSFFSFHMLLWWWWLFHIQY